MADINIRLRVTRPAFRWGLAGLVLLAGLAELGTESFTLVTTYPAPSGIYNKMITTTDTYLARDAGNVGIGTTDPDQRLAVKGSIHILGNGMGLMFPDGSLQTKAAAGTARSQTFGEAGGPYTWTRPAGVDLVWVTMVGGGGGGAGGANAGGGGGGGGGAQAWVRNSILVSGDAQVMVGAGGAAGGGGGGRGGDGGASSFGALTAAGGKGGTYRGGGASGGGVPAGGDSLADPLGSTGAGGGSGGAYPAQNGSAGGRTMAYIGGPPGSGSGQSNNAGAGGGGSSSFGQGGTGGCDWWSTSAGTGFGAGGGGGPGYGAAGSAGSKGFVTVEWVQ